MRLCRRSGTVAVAHTRDKPLILNHKQEYVCAIKSLVSDFRVDPPPSTPTQALSQNSWHYHRFPLLGLLSTRPSIPFTEACKILHWEDGGVGMEYKPSVGS